MGHSYKGSRVPFKFLGPGQGPYLTSTGEDTVAWSYQGTAPDTWALYLASAVLITDTLDVVAASSFNDGGFASPGDQIIVRGLSNDGLHYQTPRSNVLVYR